MTLFIGLVIGFALGAYLGPRISMLIHYLRNGSPLG